MSSTPALHTDHGPQTVHDQPSLLKPSLVRAYRDALYEVVLPAPHPVCTLQVGLQHPPLHQAMRSLGAQHACLLTACNPMGTLLADEANIPRMQTLREALRQAGWTWVAAMGRDPQHQWPGEDSVFIWHMGPAQAADWGARWEQNAVLTIDRDAVPQLALLR
jgi:hypothetical protein